MKCIKACVKRFIGQNSGQFVTRPSRIPFSPGEAEHVLCETKRYYLAVTVCSKETKQDYHIDKDEYCPFSLQPTALIVYVWFNLLNVFIVLQTFRCFPEFPRKNHGNSYSSKFCLCAKDRAYKYFLMTKFAREHIELHCRCWAEDKISAALSLECSGGLIEPKLLRDRHLWLHYISGIFLSHKCTDIGMTMYNTHFHPD